MNDLTIGEAIDLKKVLKLTRRWINHLNTTTELNISYQKKKVKFTNSYKSLLNEMIINKRKTKFMLFNTAKKRDFTPVFELESEQIEVVEQYKLLGIQMKNNLK